VCKVPSGARNLLATDSLRKPAITESYLMILYIKSILPSPTFESWMMMDILSWICHIRVKKWQRLSCAIYCKLFNIVVSMNFRQSFMAVVFSTSEIYKSQWVWITLQGPAHLKTLLVVVDIHITIPQRPYMMEIRSACSLKWFSQRQIYGTMEFNWCNGFLKLISIYLCH